MLAEALPTLVYVFLQNSHPILLCYITFFFSCITFKFSLFLSVFFPYFQHFPGQVGEGGGCIISITHSNKRFFIIKGQLTNHSDITASTPCSCRKQKKISWLTSAATPMKIKWYLHPVSSTHSILNITVLYWIFWIISLFVFQ